MNKFLIALVAFLTVTPAKAETSAVGADDPNFVQAVEDWLEGKDIEALQDLSVLAGEGHVPSKILISRIAATPKFSAHISDGLSRKERVQLFREPKGLSGRDWLVSASEDSELAKALWAASSSIPGQAPEFESIVPVLIAYGETKPLLALFHEAWKFGREEYAARMLLENEDLFGAAGRDLLGFLLSSMAQSGKQLPLPATVDTDEKAQSFLAWLRSDIHELAWNGTLRVEPGRVAVPSRSADRAKLAQAVHQLLDLQPLALFCEATCEASQQEACLADGVWALGQSGAFPYPFSSPAQSLIDDPIYWGSARFFGDVERMMIQGDWLGCR